MQNIVSNLLTFIIFCIGINSINSYADSYLNCELAFNADITQKLIPSCLKQAKGKKNSAMLFRWIFDENSFEFSTGKWLILLDNIRTNMTDADYSLFRGLIHSFAKEPENALMWYKKSADMGNHEAAFAAYSLLTSISQKEADKYLKMAAYGGFETAQFILGVKLLHGLQRQTDIPLAIHYIERAAYGNSAQALVKLLEMKRFLDKDSFVFWQTINLIHMESDGEVDLNKSLGKISNWPTFCEKLMQAEGVLFSIAAPAETQNYSLLMKITYNCMSVNSKGKLGLYNSNLEVQK